MPQTFTPITLPPNPPTINGYDGTTKPSDFVPGIGWTPNECANVFFAVGVRDEALDAGEEFDLGPGDVEMMSAHPTRITPVADPHADRCSYHLGGFTLDHNDDIVGLFCNGNTGGLDEYGVAVAMVQEGEDPDGVRFDGDVYFIGAYRTPPWTEAWLNSGVLTCGGEPI